MTEVKVERKASYQGVPQWGINISYEITPSRKTAEKWPALENASQRPLELESDVERERRG